MSTEPTLYTFRIRAARGKWKIETWEAEPPYGPGWQPAYSGAPTLDDARAFFDKAAVLTWDGPDRMSGRYTFACPDGA